MFDSLVPHVLRDWDLVRPWSQQTLAGYIRDNTFLIYQSNLIFAMGAIGGPLICRLLVRTLRRRSTAERNFWLALVVFSIVANFVLSSERDRLGVAHITLLTMMATGLTLLAGNFTLRRSIALLVVAGCAIDFTFGILLQSRIEHLENSPDPSVFARIQVNGVLLNPAAAGPNTLARTTGGNWFRKHEYALSQEWLRGLALSHPDGRGLTPAQTRARDVLTQVVREDDTLFGGWYKNHGGELVFFGDHFGDTDWPSIILVLACVGLLWKMARYWPPAAVPSHTLKVARAYKKR
jgi:hypothetical protein